MVDDEWGRGKVGGCGHKEWVGGGGWGVWCFFFNDTATTEIYTLSLHDALPISAAPLPFILPGSRCGSAPAFFTDHFSLRQRPTF